MIVTVAVAHAGESGQALLARGIALHREASFAASIAALEQARASKQLASTELNECGFYLAASYVAVGSLGAARRELRALVEGAPDYELPPFTSPKVAALFREVRDEAERAPRLRALPPRRHSPQDLELWFEPARAGGATYGAASWRWHGETTYREAPLTHDGGNLVARVAVDRTGMLEYFAEVRAATGLAHAGSAEQPLEVPITIPRNFVAAAPITSPTDPKKDAKRFWWVWTAAGAIALAGVGVGLYFGLRPAPSSTADAVLDFQVH
jgi:hypothetical protein